MGVEDDGWLVAYIEHITYEITGVVTSYMRLTKLDEFGKFHPIGKQGEQNDSLDLMTLHFRNLYEFFCYLPKTGYVRAVNYVPAFIASGDTKLIEKVNNQVSHLTERRHEIAQEFATKAWDANELMKWLICSLKAWQDQLDSKYNTELCNNLSPVQGFIDWYSTQIKQGKL